MIGIISWLPDDEIKRNIRYWRMRQLLVNLKQLFPQEEIVIIAQNYTDEDVENIDVKVDIRRYGKLGIVGARNTLRKIYLESNAPYLLMYDDDCDLDWIEEDAGEKFIECLLTNKYGVCFQTSRSCKNIGLKRSIVEAIEFRGYEGHDYYEDATFWDDLIQYLGVAQDYTVIFPECMRAYINDKSPYGGETYRTWTSED